MSFLSDKSALRLHFLQRRNALSAEARQTAETKITDLFLRHIQLEKTAIIAGYVPIKSELDVFPLLKNLHERGHICTLPAISSSSSVLTFREWIPKMELVKGHYAVPEPPASFPSHLPDIVIAPLLACDSTGTRLGYGKGFYDATLCWLRSHNPKIQVLGIGYACQLTEKLPCDAHDERLDTILTDQAIIHIRDQHYGRTFQI